MAISVDQSSSVVTLTHVPVGQRPSVQGARAVFTVSNITATGQATLRGGPGDSPAGWRLGFIQVELIETNWAYYRGRTQHDGSVFVQRARKPARPRQAYRDTNEAALHSPNDVYYDTAATGGVASPPPGAQPPVALAVNHFDQPSDNFDVTRLNNTTQSPNFLREAQIEFHFCTILSTCDPAGVYQHLKHFYWNVRWQATFTPSTFAPAAAPTWVVVPTGHGNGANVSPVYGGSPQDARFMSILASPQARNANQAAAAEETHPIVRESPTWQPFDVTR